MHKREKTRILVSVMINKKSTVISDKCLNLCHQIAANITVYIITMVLSKQHKQTIIELSNYGQINGRKIRLDHFWLSASLHDSLPSFMNKIEYD
jgi:hypothetical protein